MKSNNYLIQLDSDYYGWNLLWKHTITEIKKHTTKMEIISVLMPILLVNLDEAGYEAVRGISGVKNIEEECKGYL